jgi:hypothetical protein
MHTPAAATMTPSMRAKLDAERRKARAQRKMERAGPGPGAYNALLPASSGLEYAGSTAFKASSRGLALPTRNGSVDAGLYDPALRGSLSARSARTANKSAAAGNGSFGGRAVREHQFARRTELKTEHDGPASTAYTPREPDSPGSIHGSSAFTSRTKRGAYMQRDRTPGAGEYGDVSTRTPLDRAILGGQSSFRGKDERSKALMVDAMMTHVGPGSCTPRRGRSVDLVLTVCSSQHELVRARAQTHRTRIRSIQRGGRGARSSRPRSRRPRCANARSTSPQPRCSKRELALCCCGARKSITVRSHPDERTRWVISASAADRDRTHTRNQTAERGNSSLRSAKGPERTLCALCCLVSSGLRAPWHRGTSVDAARVQAWGSTSHDARHAHSESCC